MAYFFGGHPVHVEYSVHDLQVSLGGYSVLILGV